jgi:hypothetical protein
MTFLGVVMGIECAGLSLEIVHRGDTGEDARRQAESIHKPTVARSPKVRHLLGVISLFLNARHL